MGEVVVRLATPKDGTSIHHLLKNVQWYHQHVDWRGLADWLGTDGFWLAEGPAGTWWPTNEVVACLALGSDPFPAGWVRLAAVKNRSDGAEIIGRLFQQALPAMRRQGVVQLGWMVSFDWPQSWVADLGFTFLTDVQGWVKRGVDVPAGVGNPQVCIRPGQAADLPTLVQIEEAAFAPLWRHSLEGLTFGWQHSAHFDVAELGGQLIGFQYSTISRAGEAHLVRLTVRPDLQGQGVGASLLKKALNHFQQRNVQTVTLNTQSDNHASHRLYRRFGFEPAGYHLPVLVYDLTTHLPLST